MCRCTTSSNGCRCGNVLEGRLYLEPPFFCVLSEESLWRASGAGSMAIAVGSMRLQTRTGKSAWATKGEKRIEVVAFGVAEL
jgi:hypothetical protein